MIKHLFFLFIISFITSMFSIADAAYNTGVVTRNIIGTIIFLVGLSFYSYYNGLKKDSKYIKAIIFYIFIMIIIVIMSKFLWLPIINFIIISNILPLYSITNTLSARIGENIIVIIIYILELSIILISYTLGKYRFNKINRKI